ncbi:MULTISPECIES: hypothetical protein [Bradyrhizobium]|uniref:hypothetical protein n=1 Tax=Bradyrhizobium centrosematis TaxID=1300039 RepID=UPI002167CFA6|nr:hypothetical protein [Bradyrhizobium centrosematis]MCS3765546.1 hypothetical protein [Bradyrhizobium centrosematis]MCS3778080.1 hypothetical protein [Bradyrhizobium centrosematis]
MFEITGDDIADLTDTDLRTLVGRLSEAEMRRQGLSVSAVTYGGNQTAKDGGLDVRVAAPGGSPIHGFIPKPQTAFQVKSQDMPRGDILDEMKPKPAQTLRPSIIELGDLDGAYIIVSSKGSVADTALKDRRAAMAEALTGTTADGKLVLDFYDRHRMATWVREHAGVIPWVREKIGKAVPGWKAFGSWSLAPEGAESSYLFDEHARIRTGDKDEGDGISAIDGINKIREVLSKPGRVVRLAGLSGVGKTRLAEALFDPSVGDAALDPSYAIYTNVADQPNPPPVGLASDLNANETRAILVIDNCPPELHRTLSDVARAHGSAVSVITIEYDIRDDQPEGTDVFRLDTSSIELIEKLVIRRYPDLSQVDGRTIAVFSDGNARVALALASRIEKTERVSELSDEELFKRLFQQRHDADPSLLLIAQACSLVYSFEGDTLDGENAELPILGHLIGKTANEVYQGVAELQRRDLVQARAHWRAVLPHAIANRLAKMALQNIPPARVASLLVDNASERLLRSFSRRLGYLDDSKQAKAIVEGWLAPGGLLRDVGDLNELGRAIFANIAPVAPEAVLTAIERTVALDDLETLNRCKHFVRLLRSLAYEPAFYELAIAVLTAFAALTPDSEKDSDANRVVASLFYIVLSGTHAPIDMRINAAERLLSSDDEKERAVGLNAIEAMLKTDHFMSSYDFDFGARSRDHGYHPANGGEVRAWFDATLKLARGVALSNSPIAPAVKKAISQEFRDLWSRSGQAEQLDQLARDIAGATFWRDGWVAAREARRLDGSAMPPGLRKRLTELEEYLRPKDLINRVRGLVCGQRGGALDLEDFADEEEDEESGAPGSVASPRKPQESYEVRAARATAAIRELAHDVAVDENAFRALLPELMNGNDKARMFGEALAEAAEDPRAVWDEIVKQYGAMKDARLTLVGGVLQGLLKRDQALGDVVLDAALSSTTLGKSFPLLQASATIDGPALGRLHKSLDLGLAPIEAFNNLAYGRACEKIPGPEFRDLLLAISRDPGGIPVALEIIAMRLHSDAEAKRPPASEVREAGRRILDHFEFQRTNGRAHREDHELGMVVRGTLSGPEGASAARRLSRKLIDAASRHDVRAHDNDDLVNGLLRVHSTEVLDELFSGPPARIKRSVRFFQNLSRYHQNIFDGVTDEAILKWCDRAPALRYPLMASVAILFSGNDENAATEWRPLIGELLKKAPDPTLVMNEIVQRLYPSMWSGSLATVLEKRQTLLSALPGVMTPGLASVVQAANERLQKIIDAERLSERHEDKERNNRFE